MLNLLSVLYLAAFLLSGIAVITYFFPEDRLAVRLWLGCAAGLCMLLWLPALFSFALSFTLLSQILALCVAILIGATCLILSRSRKAVPADRKIPLSAVLTLVPLAAAGIYMFCTHTIPERFGALYSGQSTYGDLCMHLGFITSISVQKTFPPFYSICPDVRIGYPFLSDSVSSTFYTLGASLRFSTLLPAVTAYLLVLSGCWLFFSEWMKHDWKKTVLCTLLFFIGGGFGFVYFFDLLKQNPGNFSRIFTAFYETPTNNVSVGVKWVNPIADMLIPQRATLFGWSLLFPCLYLLHRAFFHKEYKYFIPLGIFAGCLPLVHTHSFLALGVISAVYLMESLLFRASKEELLGFLKYALITAVLAAPQLLLFTFRQSGGFLKLHFNWANEKDGFLWFYIKNLGLLFLLLPVAVFDASPRDRRIMAAPAVLWILSETIQFQPNTYDNNKLLFICFLYLCGLIGDFLVRLYRKLRDGKVLGTFPLAILTVMTCAALFASGILTLGREWVSSYQLISRDEVEAAGYVCENTEPDATFLTASNHNNAVAMLTGRNIVCGSGSFLYFHGIDYYERQASLGPMFETPSECFPEYAEKYGVDYVYIGSAERYDYDCDYGYFEEHFPLVFENGGVSIYAVTPAP